MLSLKDIGDIDNFISCGEFYKKTFFVKKTNYVRYVLGDKNSYLSIKEILNYFDNGYVKKERRLVYINPILAYLILCNLFKKNIVEDINFFERILLSGANIDKNDIASFKSYFDYGLHNGYLHFEILVLYLFILRANKLGIIDLNFNEDRAKFFFSYFQRNKEENGRLYTIIDSKLFEQMSEHIIEYQSLQKEHK